MRAVVLRGGRLEVRDTADPVPRGGELLLRTISTAICASDVHYMDHPDVDTSGLFVWDADRDVVMGHEFVGEVVGQAVGWATSRLGLIVGLVFVVLGQVVGIRAAATVQDVNRSLVDLGRFG